MDMNFSFPESLLAALRQVIDIDDLQPGITIAARSEFVNTQ
jgi:hypothetical protein